MVEPLFGDDLDKPLGTETNQRHSRFQDISYGRWAFIGVAAIAASLGLFAYVTGDGFGGDSVAVVPIDVPRIGMALANPASGTEPDLVGHVQAARETGGSSLPVKQVATAADLETDSGVKVVRPEGMGAPGALILTVPQPIQVHLTPAPDPRLGEPYDHGVLPKIGADGSKPFDVYARPVVTPDHLPRSAPHIALVIGGLGLDRQSTEDAIAHLPGAVTLGFAPYGTTLAEVSRARDQGHEIVLQAPMESFGETGARDSQGMLLSTLPPEKNIDRLHWLMSRFSGYVGVMNFLGGKFTADARSFKPILREIAGRGLLYADDGTSPRSLAQTLAETVDLPFVHTDVVIDAVGRPEAIDAALDKLEVLARRDGQAVGGATGLPLSIERIARWSEALERRGIVLIPLSAAVSRAGETAAGLTDKRVR